MQHYKLIIFDWDGTLMNPVARIVSSMQLAAEQLALAKPSEKAVKDIIGLSLPKVYQQLFPNITARQVVQLNESYRRYYVELDTTPSPLFSGVTNLLELLISQGKQLAVATGKGRAGLDRVLLETKTSHYFTASRCADECRSKPAPDMVHSLLRELDIPAEHTVVIGDSHYDLLMAKNAGVDSIAVSYGVQEKSALLQQQPKMLVDSIAELTDLFSM